MADLDYLVIGHVTRDLVGDGFRAGGTAAYAARTAQAMGCQVGVVTSVGFDFDWRPALGEATIASYPAEHTTTFENVYTSDGRRQEVRHISETLTPVMIPAHWQANVAHVGPVAQECSTALVDLFSDTFLGVTPQGWMRGWDESGRISPNRWKDAERWLDRADAVVLSEEDLAGDETTAARYARQTRVLALTQGADGCTVYARGQTRRFPAPTVEEVDSTGAGDVFAAVFFVALQRWNDPWAAARFANQVAATSVTREGLAGAPRPEEIPDALRNMHEKDA